MLGLKILWFLALAWLLVAPPAWALEAVSSLHVRDAAGQIVGPVYSIEWGDVPVVVLKTNGLLIPLYAFTSGFGSNVSSFVYESQDCSGTPFLSVPRTSLIHGAIAAPGQTVYIPDPSAVAQTISYLSWRDLGSGGCSQPPGGPQPFTGVPAIALINLADYFTPPLTVSAGCGDATRWAAQYWANSTLSGTPTVEKCEDAVNFVWWTGSPDAAIPADSFSARWTKTVSFGAGTYQFTTVSDDGIRVWVDGVLIIDNWTDHPDTINSATHTLTAGSHTLKVEYFENWGAATAVLTWVQAQ